MSLLAIVLAPLVAMALEPADPVGFCSRFIESKEIEICQDRTAKENIDWYAAAVCNLQKDDGAFWKCWDSTKEKSFNPQALEKCEADLDASDEDRQTCVNSATKSRQPASIETGIFQPLKKKK